MPILYLSLYIDIKSKISGSAPVQQGVIEPSDPHPLVMDLIPIK